MPKNMLCFHDPPAGAMITDPTTSPVWMSIGTIIPRVYVAGTTSCMPTLRPATHATSPLMTTSMATSAKLCGNVFGG
jgi:hypothetical protein